MYLTMAIISILLLMVIAAEATNSRFGTNRGVSTAHQSSRSNTWNQGVIKPSPHGSNISKGKWVRRNGAWVREQTLLAEPTSASTTTVSAPSITNTPAITPVVTSAPLMNSAGEEASQTKERNREGTQPYSEQHTEVDQKDKYTATVSKEREPSDSGTHLPSRKDNLQTGVLNPSGPGQEAEEQNKEDNDEPFFEKEFSGGEPIQKVPAETQYSPNYENIKVAKTDTSTQREQLGDYPLGFPAESRGGYSDGIGRYPGKTNGYHIGPGEHRRGSEGYLGKTEGYHSEDGGFHTGSGGFHGKTGEYPGYTEGYQSENGGHHIGKAGFLGETGGYPGNTKGYHRENGGNHIGKAGFHGETEGYPRRTGGGYLAKTGEHHIGTEGYTSGFGVYSTRNGEYHTGSGVYSGRPGGYTGEIGKYPGGSLSGRFPPETLGYSSGGLPGDTSGYSSRGYLGRTGRYPPTGYLEGTGRFSGGPGDGYISGRYSDRTGKYSESPTHGYQSNPRPNGEYWPVLARDANHFQRHSGTEEKNSSASAQLITSSKNARANPENQEKSKEIRPPSKNLVSKVGRTEMLTNSKDEIRRIKEMLAHLESNHEDLSEENAEKESPTNASEDTSEDGDSDGGSPFNFKGEGFYGNQEMRPLDGNLNGIASLNEIDFKRTKQLDGYVDNFGQEEHPDQSEDADYEDNAELVESTRIKKLPPRLTKGGRLIDSERPPMMFLPVLLPFISSPPLDPRRPFGNYQLLEKSLQRLGNLSPGVPYTSLIPGWNNPYFPLHQNGHSGYAVRQKAVDANDEYYGSDNAEEDNFTGEDDSFNNEEDNTAADDISHAFPGSMKYEISDVEQSGARSRRQPLPTDSHWLNRRGFSEKRNIRVRNPYLGGFLPEEVDTIGSPNPFRSARFIPGLHIRPGMMAVPPEMAQSGSPGLLLGITGGGMSGSAPFGFHQQRSYEAPSFM